MSKIKCLQCGQILESKFRHDFQQCKCPNETFIDGGNDYLRCGGMDLSKIHVIIEPNPEIEKIEAEKKDILKRLEEIE